MEQAFKRLQAWYLGQCDGEWEHTYGVQITTLDNPGWGLEIDLVGTELENRPFDKLRIRRTEIDNWYVCGVEQGKFKSYCGPMNLTEVIDEFLNWAENSLGKELTSSRTAKSLTGAKAPLFGELQVHQSSGSVQREGNLDDAVAAICDLLGDTQAIKERTSYLVIDTAFSLQPSLNEEQHNRIIASIVRNYGTYGVVELCIKAADYCVRSQSIEASLQSLKSLAAKPLNDAQVYGVLEGLESLYKLKRANPDTQSKCRQAMQTLRSVRIVGDGDNIT